MVVEERRDPFQIIDIYNHKILANQCIAAIRRTQRNQAIDTADLVTFQKLSRLLDEAYSADQNVSGAGVKASSKYSLKILSQTLKAMQGTLKGTSSFRARLDDLHKASAELSQNKIVSDPQLNMLFDFCRRYATLQRQLLKQPSTRASYGVTAWPFASLIRHT
jgi:hypothetical protein